MATNNLNLLRMAGGGGGGSVQPQQILIQSGQQQQQGQGQIMATTANGATVFLNAQHQIVGTAGAQGTSAGPVQVKQDKGSS